LLGAYSQATCILINLPPKLRHMSDSTSSPRRFDIHNSDVPIICRSCEARHKGICGALTPSQLNTLSKSTTIQAVPAERQFAMEGDRTGDYSNIISGIVKLSKLMADGRQQIVALQFAPDLVGRPFDTANKTSIEAATDLKLCSFPRKALESLIAEAPDLEHRLHQQNLRELDDARDWLLALGRKTANERVASFIYFTAQHIDPEALASGQTISFQLPLKRSDIADFLGLTLETVSRQITKLRQAKVIELIDSKTVKIHDLPKLRILAEAGDTSTF
jgi:CRP/FNR family transcriptional regulator, anaerobic regulatory protein